MLELNGLAWLIWGYYWWKQSSWFSKPKWVQPKPGRIAYALGLAISFTLIFCKVDLTFKTTLISFIGLLLTLIGLSFMVWARVHLKHHWSANVMLKEEHELIQSGPYAFVRHPIYTGFILAFFGSAICNGTYLAVIAFLIMFAQKFQKLILEEKKMIEEFGAAYLTYMAQVGRLIPGL